jgi:hypothetical protein
MKMDYVQLRAIVATKLTMDNRRQLVAYRRRSKAEPGNTFIMTLVFYSIFGGFVSLAVVNIPSFVLSMIVFFTYIMVMVSMTLITDFSSILLDTSDNTIILPRPVDSRTLFAARLTHILLYLSQLALGLSLIPAIVVLVQHGGWILLTFLVLIGLAIVTSVVMTNALYLLLMQVTSEEKLKSIINYFQIVMAIFIMAGYQILPRMIERIDIKTFDFVIQWWAFLLPPVWMAGTLEMIKYNVFDTGHLGLAACAGILPVIGVYIVNKYLSPVFNKKIASLGGGTLQIEPKRIGKSKSLSTILQWITTTAVERGTFELVYKVLGRDRKIKLKIYPSFGYIAVFGAILMMRSQEDFASTWANLPNTQYHLMLLYLTFMVLQVALYEVPYSDDFKASWIYFSAPLASPGDILTGTIKAIFVRLFLPGYFIISVFVLLVWGISAIDDIIIAFFNNMLMLMILASINKRHLPLSMAPDIRAQSGNLVRSILTFLLIATLGASHYLLTLFTQKLYMLGVIPIQVFGLYLLLRAYKRTSWNQVTL